VDNLIPKQHPQTIMYWELLFKMKKIYSICLFAFVSISVLSLVSCSKKDDKKTETVQNIIITVASTCSTSSGSGGTINKYCISKATYDIIDSAPLRPCPYHTFKTLDGQTKSGYLQMADLSTNCN
jgi:hypothetical protein